MLLPFNEFSQINPVIAKKFWARTTPRLISLESRSQKFSVKSYLSELSYTVKYPYKLDHNIIDDEDGFIKNLKYRKDFNDAPLVYLSFHGEPGSILFDRDSGLGLDDLVYPFENDQTREKVIYFSSCSVLKGEYGNILANHLLKDTNCKAVIGYTQDLKWFEALFIDMLFIHKFFSHEDPIAAIQDIYQEVLRDYVPANKLGLKMFRNSTEKVVKKVKV